MKAQPKAPRLQNTCGHMGALLVFLSLSSCATRSTPNVLADMPSAQTPAALEVLLGKNFQVTKLPDVSSLPDTLETQLPFACVFEEVSPPPPPHPEADMLFQHAQWLHEKNLEQKTLKSRYGKEEEAEEEEEEDNDDTQTKKLSKDQKQVLRLHRIAAAWGHEEATRALLKEEDLSQTLAQEVAYSLMHRNIPHGYYLQGYLLYQSHGLSPIALQYFRKAADLGNPQAQYFLWDKLTDCQRADLSHSLYFQKMAQEMLRCAAEQGHAKALYMRGCCSEEEEALKYLQEALRRGSGKAARKLQETFLKTDEERAARYGRINRFLEDDEYEYGYPHPPFPYRSSRPTVEEMDDIVPLPPAQLPEWDGHIAWVKKREKEAWEKKWGQSRNVIPPLPAEARIREMALAKGLHPKTGLKTPAQPSKEQTAFTCSFEETRIPPTQTEPDKLFEYANWLYKKSLRARNKRQSIYETREEEKDLFPEMERLHRIAAAWGHDKAASHLAHLLLEKNRLLHHENGEALSGDFLTQPVDIAEALIRRGIPHGYALMGVLLSNGYGVKQDSKTAQNYFLRAAELGNPEAQFYVGSLQQNREMMACAAKQGHVKAALYMAEVLRQEEKYDEALRHLQRAVQAGSVEAAETLEAAFVHTEPGIWPYMGQAEVDKARSARYREIRDILKTAAENQRGEKHDANFFVNATVDEIDAIVPLPPTRLPAWDKQIEWMKKWNAYAPPPLPSPQRIREMALAKGLDFNTGYPLKKDASGKPADELSQTPKQPKPFLCVHEESRIPKRDADADKLWRQALRLHMQEETPTPETFAQVERLTRIAAAWGHDKAQSHLARLLADNPTASEDKTNEAVEMAETLIRRGIPHGYFLKAQLLDEGHSIQKDSKAPLQYLRRAADLGDPQAQYEVGKKLLSAKGPAHEIGKEMMRCAATQGNGEAALHLAFHFSSNKEERRYWGEKRPRDKKKDWEALTYLQLAVKGGNAQAAAWLSAAFLSPAPEENADTGEEGHYYEESHEEENPFGIQQQLNLAMALAHVGLPKDEERAARYQTMEESLKAFAFFNPTVEDIGHIVPLPPLKLPTWNGEMAWVKHWKKDEASPLDEKRIEKMARAKGLKPQTGLPTKQEAK